MKLHEWLTVNKFSLSQGAEHLGMSRPTLVSLITRGSHAAELGCRMIDATQGFITEKDILHAMSDPGVGSRIQTKLDSYRVKHGLSKHDMCSLIGYTGRGAKLNAPFKCGRTAAVIARTEGLVTLRDLAETHLEWHKAQR